MLVDAIMWFGAAVSFLVLVAAVVVIVGCLDAASRIADDQRGPLDR